MKKEGADPNPLPVKKEGASCDEDDDERSSGVELRTGGGAGARGALLHDRDKETMAVAVPELEEADCVTAMVRRWQFRSSKRPVCAGATVVGVRGSGAIDGGSSGREVKKFWERIYMDDLPI
jgi:hypothetical protein